jgi:tetratricopeptide (TPR) repeat protein
MERIEEWQFQLRLALEKIAHHIHKHHRGDFPIHKPLLEERTDLLEKKALLIFEKIEKGMRAMISSLPEILQHTPALESQKIVQALGDMITIASVIVQDAKPSLELMKQGTSMQEALEINEETLSTMYLAAKYLYEQEQYDEASSAFCLLSLLNPGRLPFWLGLGNSEFFLHRYQEALLAYGFASQVTESDSLPHILSAKCHMALENYPAAKLSLALAEMVQDKHKHYQKQIDSLREDLRRFLP